MSDAILPIPAIPAVLREDSQRGVLIPLLALASQSSPVVPPGANAPTARFELASGSIGSRTGQLAQIRHLTPRVKLSIARGLKAEHGLTRPILVW
jgi:hypothetical protein